jgi:hypothetical protein
VISISVLFNLVVLLAKVRSSRLCLKHGGPDDDDNANRKPRPALVPWAIELLGTVAYLCLYIASTIDTSDEWSWRRKIMLKTYASVGTLVAL